jgi:hypothetical protein
MTCGETLKYTRVKQSANHTISARHFASSFTFRCPTFGIFSDLRASPKIYYFFLLKTCSFITSKKILAKKRRSSPRVSNNILLKHRRQFYIKNPILSLNYRNHLYIFFLSLKFASETLSYFLFFPTPFHL